MIDFSQLRVLTAEERKQADERHRQQAIDQDTAQRRERSRRTVTIALTCDAEFRHTMQGTKLVSFRGKQSNGKPVQAVWYAPDYMDHEEFRERSHQYIEGSTWQLAGYWKPFKNNSRQTSFTFVAQFVEPIAA
ncbi:MAG TPA: hypothetical protein VMU78_08590 [Methylocella sp.]|nr:hypothetical protein [Methylocella sp.]